ncbi:hypothetical protein [Lysobacter gummosus]
MSVCCACRISSTAYAAKTQKRTSSNSEQLRPRIEQVDTILHAGRDCVV